MDLRNPIDIPCKLCSHPMWYHQKPSIGLSWYCDFDNCGCDDYFPLPPKGQPGNEIVVPYDSTSYKYN